MTSMESQTVRIMPHRVERIMDGIFARLGVEGDERRSSSTGSWKPPCPAITPTAS